ncbi:MAG: hypothetical protein KFF73_00145 [Cyclobacteriaceae bacterium]|nr:hypothetical protein [Cyclobacteriaceae bacterium]
MKLKKITEEAIKSIDKQHNTIVIESNPSAVYRNSTTIYPDMPFNYNKYLNIGARTGDQEFIFFGNNDLIFEKNWDEEIGEKMNEHNLVSASPLCPDTHLKFGIEKNSGVLQGYEVYKFFCGWAFVMRRSFYENIGGLNEMFNFWCSDNAIVNQLKKENAKHALVTSSIVHHLNQGGNTLESLSLSKIKSYTVNELKKYNHLFNANLIIDYTWDMPEILRKSLFPDYK